MSLIPFDKFKPENVLKYKIFAHKVKRLSNHWKYHYLDKKHMVNADCINKVVSRTNPLTGQVHNIAVSGTFREKYSMFCIITPSPLKAKPSFWHCDQDNGNAASFTVFIEMLITANWFERGDVLVLDNAAIHSGAQANIVEDILWHQAGVLVDPLPA